VETFRVTGAAVREIRKYHGKIAENRLAGVTVYRRFQKQLAI